MGFIVEEGDGVRFWYDDWMAVGPLCLLFPKVFRVVSSKESSVKKWYVLDGNVVSWDVSVRRNLHQLELVERESLLSLLAIFF